MSHGAAISTQATEVSLTATPAPWNFNPSGWHHRVGIALVASVALLIATYLALFQWGLIKSVWDPVFGAQSESVLTSDVSHTLRAWIGVPDAALGALAYLGDIIFALAGSTRRWQYRPWIVVLFGLNVIPLGIVSPTLVVLQGTIVGAWCFPCLVTAVISLVLVALAFEEVYSCFLYLRGVWRETRSAGDVGRTLLGRPSPVAYKVGEELARSVS